MHALLTRRRGRVAAVAAAVLTAATLATVPAQPASAQSGGCLAVGYQATTWSTGPDTGGFVVNLTITNTCDERIEGWSLSLNLAPEHRLSHGWGATWSTSGAQVTATNLAWNGELDPDRSVTVGFVGSYAGTFQDPLTCHINGLPCDGGPENQPPQVVLDPTPSLPWRCDAPLTAEASDPDGEIDRVEFYLNGALVATDDQAPYDVVVSGDHPAMVINNVAFARAFDIGDPPQSADSEPITFSRPPPPPALMLGSCNNQVELVEGASAQVTVLSYCGQNPLDVELTVTGDPGISVSPSAFTFTSGRFDVTISAAPGSAGGAAEVRIQAIQPNCLPATIQVSVTGAGG